MSTNPPPLDYGVDGIGIDLESKNLADRALRNERAIELVRNAADLASDVPVGAVVFAPQALSRYEPETWPDFPWAEVAAEADLLVHVVDGAGPDPIGHTATVREVLAEIGAGQVPELLCFNKADVSDEVRRLVARNPGSVGVSAKTGEGMEDLLLTIGDRLRAETQVVDDRACPGAVEIRQQGVDHHISDQMDLVVPVSLGPEVLDRIGGGGDDFR